MRTLVLLLTASAALSVAGAAGAAVEGPSPLPALVGDGTTSSVAWVDRVTLRPLPGPQSYVGLHDIPYSFAPDGSLLALGSGRTTSLVVVDLRRMKVVGRLDTRFTTAVAWLSPRRLVLVETRLEGSARRLAVAIVDPVGLRVVSRRALPASYGLLSLATGREVVVLLLGPAGGIGTPLLVVVTPDGARFVRVMGIDAGAVPPDLTAAMPIARSAHPGLAIDSDAQRAFVVPAAGAIAEVELASLAVSYHVVTPVPTRTPSAAADGGNLTVFGEGTYRQAVWLGEGLIGVSGRDEKIVQSPEGPMQISLPAGLSLVDVSSWRARLLARDPSSFTLARNLLVAWSDPLQMAVYRPDGRVAFRRRLPTATSLHVAGRYAYLGLGNEYRRHRVRVLDLRTGRVLRTVFVPGWFYPLSRGSPDVCWC